MRLYKKGDSKFWWYDFKLKGVPRQRGSTKETNQKRAETIALIHFKNALDGRSIIKPKKVPTLAEQWEAFRLSALYTQRNINSRRYYATGWRLVKDSSLAKTRLTEIRGIDITDLMIPGSPSNINCARRTVRRLLKVAQASEMITKMPVIPLLPEPERDALLDEAAEARLMPHAEQPLKDVIVLIRECGMRNAREVYPMRIEEVDWVRSIYYVPDSKSPAGRREIPLTDRALLILKNRCEGRTEGWVFPSVRQKKHITGGLVNKQWVRARKAAGLSPRLKLYSGRHDFGTFLMDQTGDMKLVMQMMGHTDPKATLRYLKPSMEKARNALNRRTRKVLPFAKERA